jgi:hypothetical protein
MRLTAPLLFLIMLVGPLAAQDFAPPEDEEAAPTTLKFGLHGFSSRLGLDFTGSNQIVASSALDVLDLYSERVRFRPSFEIGVGGGVDTYLVNAELVYRFAADNERAIPYVGFGLGIYGQPGCSAAPRCPRVWPQFALGFELHLRGTFNWLLEYHGEDALRRHRFFLGLATRRGS